MPTPESGKSGAVKISSTSVGEVLKWTARKTAVVDVFGSSESAGYQKSIAGRKGISGTIEGKWDSAAAAPILEGASVTLQLYLNATELLTVPAIMEEFEITVDINTGVANAFRANYQSTGAYTEPTLS